MPAISTFCNPDPQAIMIAQELHRSDVDILMVQDQSPTVISNIHEGKMQSDCFKVVAHISDKHYQQH